jgi:hypothetical protein
MMTVSKFDAFLACPVVGIFLSFESFLWLRVKF